MHSVHVSCACFALYGLTIEVYTIKIKITCACLPSLNCGP